MSYKTLEVELENGQVHPCGAETLPAKGHGWLTLLDSGKPSAARNCSELADRWSTLDKLPLDEANAFAADIDQSRANLPSLRAAWD
jgi:hypothetical protein